MEEFFEKLESLPLTIVSGVALAVSLVFIMIDFETPYDPAYISIVISGLPLLYEALHNLFMHRKITSALLITIAMIACLYIGEIFAAGEVAFIMAIGELLEDYSVDRAKRGITNLMSLAPEEAKRIIDNREEIIPIDKVQVGDTLRVIPGEKIPVDGIILAGNTSIDQSILTGESLPVDKKEGDKVFCGTMNRYGSIDIKAEKVYADSSLQKMINMVQEAEDKKAPTQRIVDKWASWLVPIALVIAILALLITGDLTRCVTVLVVFCPCALALATPVSIVAGIGQATKFGVLIKSGEALETMGNVDVITFDKTGTLTKGILTVSDVCSFSNIGENELLRLVASVESKSEHPIGKAVVAGNNEELYDCTDFKMTPGKGVEGTVGGRKITCMNAQNANITEDIRVKLDTLQRQGKACVVVQIDGKVSGIIGLSDVVRETSRAMVEELNKMNVETIMLTGDNDQTAKYLAEKVGIRNVRANLLPEDKVKAIHSLLIEGKKVCMIGDGVNDAPALKSASVSIAMGGMGSDIAVDASDICLMSDDISRIPYIKRLSNAVIRSIKVNITLSMAINLIAVTLSVLGLMGPIIGALVHNAGSVLVVLNAAMLYDRKV